MLLMLWCQLCNFYMHITVRLFPGFPWWTRRWWTILNDDDKTEPALKRIVMVRMKEEEEKKRTMMISHMEILPWPSQMVKVTFETQSLECLHGVRFGLFNRTNLKNAFTVITQKTKSQITQFHRCCLLFFCECYNRSFSIINSVMKKKILQRKNFWIESSIWHSSVFFCWSSEGKSQCLYQ